MNRHCGICALALAGAAGLATAQNTGPSSSQSPYVLPSIPGVSTTSILTVGDTIGGYRMIGIPDGMGGFSNGDGTFTLMVNHELGATSGTTRAHGSTGAFVSRWNINANAGNLVVNSGRDHNTAPNDVYTWNGSSYVPGTTQWARFCSGDLAAPSAYRFGTLGTDARIYMNGEEAGSEGRAFAHIVTGASANQSYELPYLGRFSWENSVASPFAQQKTIVVGTDDSTPGRVYVYVGNKTDTGNDFVRAGLTGGSLYGVRVNGLPTEQRAAGAAGRFDLFNAGNVSNMTGGELNTLSNSNSVTNFLRPEDGAWDPRPGHQNDFYFVTTDRFDNANQVGRSRLYRLRFDDITNPEAGGAVTELFSTINGPQMMDNMCIDSLGRVLIQEDIGGNAALGKIWLYDIDSGGYAEIAHADPARFTSGLPGFLTQDEESSGIFDAGDILGPGWFAMNMQAHYGNGTELVEGGQLLAMYVDPSIVPAPGAGALLGIGGLLLVRRRRRA